MNINFNGNELILDLHGEKLKIRHISQLDTWGFKETSGTYVQSNPSQELLPKVITYFEKSLFSVNLSKQCQLFLKKINDRQDEFDSLKICLSDFKSGKVDEDELKQHINSLKSLSRPLKDHQIKSSFHLYKSKNGANFSVPGSGKTTVVLAVYQRLKNEGKVDALFIIGPPSCFGAWKDEFKAVLGKEPTVTIFAGGDSKVRKEEYYKKNYSELNLSTFQTLARDYDYIPKLFTTARVFLVVDEGHYIKQIGGEWANAVLFVSPYAEYRAVLTGTPMPKGYSDFYNLFDFLFPDIQVLDNTQKAILNMYEKDANTESAIKLFEKTIEPLFYRVRKKDLNLAEQVFCKPIKIKMNPYEWEVYDAIFTKIISYSQIGYSENIEYVKKLIRGRMMRLRQCISYTKLLATTIDDYDEDLLSAKDNLKKIVFNYDNYEKPAKLEKLIELVKKFMAKDQKVLIWSNFIGTIKLIESELKSHQYFCKKIIGETPTERTTLKVEETREDIRRLFVDPNSDLKILIANPAACAESISLHKSCNNAIYYDLSYNCAQYLQSLDRIHRVGGSEERPSYYNFLQYENSIDSSILDNLKKKAERMAALIDKDYQIYSLDMFDISDEISAYYELIDS